MRKILFLMVLLIVAAPVYAAEDCNPAHDVIFKLAKPEYPANTVWSAIYGDQDAQERFVGGTLLESGNVLAVGERFAHEDENAVLVVAEIDKFGRLAWDQANKIPGLRSVNTVLARKTGFIVSGRSRSGKEKAEIWIGFFDFGGKLLRTKIIKDSKFALEPQDIVPLQTGGGYLMAAAAEERGGVHHTVIYRLDADGKEINHKAFSPGLDNAILALSPSKMDQYVGSGYIRSDDGRKTGWLVMFNKNAEIVWQRQYPRGHESQINRTADYMQGTIIAAGETVPTGGEGNRAGWVMLVDAGTGDIAWQRYYTSVLDESARDLLLSDKGLVTVLLDGSVPDKSEEQASLRLVTLNPRGVVALNDMFVNGEGAHGYRLLEGPGSDRMVLGSTDMSYRKKEIPLADQKDGPFIVASPKAEDEEASPVDENAALKRSVDGLLMAVVPAGSYVDPCVAP